MTEKSISVGWAQRDITPSRPVLLRGLFNLRVSTRTRDPLQATALALDNGDDQVVFVTVDACGVSDDIIATCRDAVHAACPDLPGGKLVINATHTHTAPFAGESTGLQKEEQYLDALRRRYPDYMTIADYTEMLTDGIVEVACAAWRNRKKGCVGWGLGYAVVGENRRVRYFDDRAVMYGSTAAEDFSHIEGHVDHTVNLLFTYAEDDALTGVVINVACPSQANEGGQDYISADYWHDVRAEIRRRFGDGVMVLPQCSAAGDQTPHRQIAARAEDRMLRLKYGDGLGRGDNGALRKDIARRLGHAVAETEPAVRKDLRDAVTIRHERHSLDVPHWNVADAELEQLTAEIEQLKARLEELQDDDPLSRNATATRSRLGWCERAMERYHNPPESITIQANIARIGDVAFATAPFEYYLDFGDRIKGRSPAMQTFVVQLAGRGTYLPTQRAARGCSYGAVPASCMVPPEGGQIIVDHVLESLDRFFNNE